MTQGCWGDTASDTDPAQHPARLPANWVIKEAGATGTQGAPAQLSAAAVPAKPADLSTLG